MATIEKYETRGGATLYRVRYRTPDHRQTDRRGFEPNATPRRSPRRWRVSKLGPAWLERKRGHLKPSSYAVMETTWRLRVKPRWGKVALGDIRPTAVQQWITDLGYGTDDVKPVGASVMQRTHYVLAAILADAVRDNLIVRNPAAGVKLPRTSRRRPLYLTHQQVSDLAASAGAYEGLVLLLAYTGLRWGEGIGLRVHHLDLLRRRASVTENAVQSGTEIFVGSPKAHKLRTVPVPDFLVPYLARQCEGKGRDDLLWPGDKEVTHCVEPPDLGVVRQGRHRVGHPPRDTP